MGFIKHAIIGIALYELVKYGLMQVDCAFKLDGGKGGAPGQQLRKEEVDVVAGARQTDQLDRMKENAKASG